MLTIVLVDFACSGRPSGQGLDFGYYGHGFKTCMELGYAKFKDLGVKGLNLRPLKF